jgi:hypothetical protein
MGMLGIIAIAVVAATMILTAGVAVLVYFLMRDKKSSEGNED